ncbi:hypothetical protein [Flavilitoribacter nigricans]|uniref:DUF4332 domain-containing protein n=1 Tax=Flavilitoribacter nigricans (strain ATCC 23147 / DSM 23189 / NBRC 102662 / NCIMB 1420 / SS-2) TaxID=1122177 RepID=A0A2D0N1G6_FLAN2|nr:hypothetical protein [Flavilitoribacter nigricans]PHN02228.1 hypothetical protein CRP01_33380 [Flavilitoribacter nigricans DSM 23189 = NBRC 102662]
MIASVQTLLEIRVQHEYFGDRHAVDLIQIGNNIINASVSIGINRQKDRIVIYKNAQDQVDQQLPLIFPLWFQDPTFTNYTAIDLVHTGRNNMPLPQIESPKILLFCASKTKEIITSEDARLLPIHPLRFTYPVSTEEWQTLKKIQIVPITGEAFFLPLPGLRPKLNYQFDLSNAGPGAYEAIFTFSDRSDKTYAFFASDTFSFRPPPAALLVPPEAMAIESGIDHTYNFSLVFPETHLQVVEGIGPKLEAVLHAAGISNWSKLAAAQPEELRTILTNADPNHRIHHPGSWPEQAALAQRGDWKGLITFQHQLHAGRKDRGDGETPAKVSRKVEQQTGIAVEAYAPEPLKLKLWFKAKSTYWQYFLQGLANEDWKDIQVSTIRIGNKEISFKKETDPIDLPTGGQAWVISSQKPIPLRDRPSWKVRLSTPYLSEGLVLPAAQPGIIKRKDRSAANPKWYSEIFIKL